MGSGSRPATCASCGKRLSRKQWYYRNGKYFCKKRCWVTERTKGTNTAQTAQAKNTEPSEPPKKAPAEAPAKS